MKPFGFCGWCLLLLLLSLAVASVSAQGGSFFARPPQDGLYSEEKDGFPVLTGNKLADTVTGSENAWIVEFFKSWCGYCIRFSETWKQLANDISDWKPVVRVAVVDCAEEENVPLCASHDIRAVPHIKIFPPKCSKQHKGDELVNPYNPVKTVESIRRETVDYLTKVINQDNLPSHWPELAPLSVLSVRDIWLNVPNSINLIFIIVENEYSYTGREVILDTMNLRDRIRVFRTVDTDQLYQRMYVNSTPAFVMCKRGQVPQPLLQITAHTRQGYTRFIRSIMTTAESSVATVTSVPPTTTPYQPTGRILSEISINPYQVSRQDLDNALYQIIKVEIPMQNVITGRQLYALKRFLRIMTKYFPARKEVRIFIKNLFNWVRRQKSISSATFLAYVNKSQTPTRYLPEPSAWRNCVGSSPRYRGYTCGLWTLFHVLTVQHYDTQSHAINFNRLEVLYGMSGYVKYFFSCEECSQHYQLMAANMSYDVKTNEDSVLWLWQAHNHVNARLKGDETEDPAVPKVIFPPVSICPDCHAPGHPEKFVFPQLMSFLTEYYSWKSIVE